MNVRRLMGACVLCAVLTLLLAVLVMPVAAGDVSINRTIPQQVYHGGEFMVTLSIEGLDAGGIIETLPDGFTFVRTEHPTEQTSVTGQNVVFSVVGEDEITYRVRPSVLGTHTFTGIWADVALQTEGTIPGNTVSVAASGGGGGSSDNDDISALVNATETSAENVTGTPEAVGEKTFTIDGSAVCSVFITGPADIGASSFCVKTVDCPVGVPPVDNVAFRYLQMNLTGCADDAITGAKVRFSVDRSWFDEHSISEASIVFARYHDGWTSLPTKRIRSGDTDTTLMYEATVPGFSLFAITGREIIKSESQTNAPSETHATVAVPHAAIDVSAQTAESNDETGGTGLPVIGGIVLIVVVAGLLAGFWFLRGRENEDEVKK